MKLVVCYQLGRRDGETAPAFMKKLEHAAADRFQLTTDGFAACVEAIEQTFGEDIDFAQLVKEYKSDHGKSHERRYSPGNFVKATKVKVRGNPDKKNISTSYVKRQNLTMRWIGDCDGKAYPTGIVPGIKAPGFPIGADPFKDPAIQRAMELLKREIF